MIIKGNGTLRHPSFILLLFAMASGVGFLFVLGVGTFFLLDDAREISRTALLADASIEQFFWQFFPAELGGGSGRLIGYLTFWLQFKVGVSSVESLKLVNIAIHCVNSFLVAALVYQIARARGYANSLLVACLIALIWAMHPLHLSTVLYTIQRLVLLATLFTLLSLNLLLVIRTQVLTGRSYRLVGCSTALYCGLSALAVFSKEIGAMIPVYALAIEFYLRSNTSKKSFKWRVWSTVFVWFPLGLIFFILGYMATHEARWLNIDMTVGERLLTQTRVLADYVNLILFPRLNEMSLFHDDYVVSRGLFNPMSTLFALVGWVVVLLGSFALRKKFPVLLFAVIWFLGGHLLESTTIPVELYFEHRNYLPMLGLVALVVAAGAWVFERMKRVALVGAAAYGLLLVSITVQGAHLWSDENRLIRYWALNNPESLRAQLEQARLAFIRGDRQRTLVELERIAGKFPDDLDSRFKLQILTCDRLASPPLIKGIVEVIPTATQSFTLFSNLNQLGTLVRQGQCSAVDLYQLEQAVQALLANPRFTNAPDKRESLHYEMAVLQKAQNDVGAAIHHIEEAINAQPNPQNAYLKALWLNEAGRFDEARKALSRAQVLSLEAPPGLPRFADEIAELENTMGEKQLGRD